jgi:hypothetical protein
MRTPLGNRSASPATGTGHVTFDGVAPLGGSRSSSERASVALRLKVFLARAKLDRQIAGGRSCESSAALALRARQLTDSSTRWGVAHNLRETVDYVHRNKSRRVISAVVIEPAAVMTGRRAILGLARRLEGAAPVSPGGVVRARALLTDGLSPLFNPNCERTVAQAVSEVHDALEGLPVFEWDARAA